MLHDDYILCTSIMVFIPTYDLQINLADPEQDAIPRRTFQDPEYPIKSYILMSIPPCLLLLKYILGSCVFSVFMKKSI